MSLRGQNRRRVGARHVVYCCRETVAVVAVGKHVRAKNGGRWRDTIQPHIFLGSFTGMICRVHGAYTKQREPVEVLS